MGHTRWREGASLPHDAWTTYPYNITPRTSTLPKQFIARNVRMSHTDALSWRTANGGKHMRGNTRPEEQTCATVPDHTFVGVILALFPGLEWLRA